MAFPIGDILQSLKFAFEKLPARLLALMSELDGKPEVSVAADVVGASSGPQQSVGSSDLAAGYARSGDGPALHL